MTLNRVIRFLLSLRSRDYKSQAISSALIVAPHPDDETFGCGGLIYKMATNESAIVVVFISDGSASHPGHPTLTPIELAGIRRKEAISSLGILGVPVSGLVFLDAKDGTLSALSLQESTRVEERISSLLAAHKPDVIFLPCRDDGSSEHEAAFVLVQQAIERSGHQPRLLEYPIWTWWSPIRLARVSILSRRVWRARLGGAVSAKLRAIAGYVSQAQPISPEAASALPKGFPEMFGAADEYYFER